MGLFQLYLQVPAHWDGEEAILIHPRPRAPWASQQQTLSSSPVSWIEQLAGVYRQTVFHTSLLTGLSGGQKWTVKERGPQREPPIDKLMFRSHIGRKNSDQKMGQTQGVASRKVWSDWVEEPHALRCVKVAEKMN